MSITVEAFLSGDEVLRSRGRDYYAEGEIVYYVERPSGQDDASRVVKGTIKKESYSHNLGPFQFALAIWKEAKIEPTDDASHVVRAPYSVLDEQEVLYAIAHAGGLIRADSDRTVDQLVMNPTGNNELAPILSDRLVKKLEF